MSGYKYKAELVEKLPECIQLDTVVEIETKNEWYGHSIGTAVGRVYDDGKIKSFFKHDGDGTEWFDMLREAGKLTSIHRYLIDRKTYEESTCDEYYLMRKIVDHVSGMPTITDDCLDTCCNVKYEYTYELLLVADEYKRYVAKTVRTEGPYTYCLMDEIKSLEDLVEEWAEEEENGFFYDDENQLCCKMYNDFGEEINADFYSARELLMSLNSIRLVKLERIIVEPGGETDEEINSR